MEPEIVPAILVKTKQDLHSRINLVSPFVKEIQLDIMDGVFVPNKTIGLESIHDLPKLPNAKYEFHWMVKHPEDWVKAVQGPYGHLVHVETIQLASFPSLQRTVKKSGGSLGLAINPETKLDVLLEFLSKYPNSISRVLIMTVHPGFSGQKYIEAMSGKIRSLRLSYPDLDIEVDGGINMETARHAYSNGANLLAAASAIFDSKNISQAIADLKRSASTN